MYRKPGIVYQQRGIVHLKRGILYQNGEFCIKNDKFCRRRRCRCQRAGTLTVSDFRLFLLHFATVLLNLPFEYIQLYI